MTFRRHITIFLNQIYENAEADIHNEIRTCYILLKLLDWGGKGDSFLLMAQKRITYESPVNITSYLYETRNLILNRLADGYDLEICESFNPHPTNYLY